MKSSFSKNLVLGFGLSFFLLLLSSAASFISIQSLLDSSRWVNHTNEVIKDLESIISTMKDAETGQRGFLLTGREVFLEPYTGSYNRALNTLDNVAFLTVDNPQQQRSASDLRNIIKNRLSIISTLIREKQTGHDASLADLLQGKEYMDQARQVVKTMEDRENSLLELRTGRFKDFSGFTPPLVILVSILSLGITVFFFVRLRADYEQREKLEAEVRRNNEVTSRRIVAIQAITGRISQGDYAVRAVEESDDDLGVLSGHLNAMALSLETSFTRLRHNEWLEASLGSLAARLIGEKEATVLLKEIIDFLCQTLDCQAGIIYITDQSTELYAAASFSVGRTRLAVRPEKGSPEWECYASGQAQVLNDLPHSRLNLEMGLAGVNLGSLACLPIRHELKTDGVLELGALTPFTPIQIAFLERAALQIGASLVSSGNRRRLQLLLEETQAQSEELQNQHAELENLNTELEGKTQKLQASEEELRVQQEELMQINQELEERTRLLEEKNQLIVERNLDIQKKAEELETSTRYKSEFMANMSHELRTPLNSILLLSRLLSENHSGNLDAEQIESSQVIMSSGNALLSLIDEILDLSKIEAGKMNLDFEQVSFDEVRHELGGLFTPIAREKDLKFEFEHLPGLPEFLQTDKLRLEQILKNLLSNALKFTSRGSVSVNAGMHPERNGWVRYAVSDTGIGVAAGKQKLIFEAFQQADGSTRRKYGGTGLGLSISRELAKLLQGEISLESEPGKGSTFRLDLPLVAHATAKDSPAEIPTGSDPAARPATRVTEEAGAEAGYLLSARIPDSLADDRESIVEGDSCILIVEDDINFAAVLVSTVRRSNYKCILAVRGDHALELALKYRPLAILLDIVLPVMNGWQVMEQLKSNIITRPIPVHIMSSIEAKKESILKGAVDFIGKPFAIEKVDGILKKLEHVIHKKHKKVLIIEENTMHARALENFLESYDVVSDIAGSVPESLEKLRQTEIECVILDMGIPGVQAYEALEKIKSEPGLSELPIIVFTGKSLSKGEESRIMTYADSIVVKTAFSYQRILDEVSLFLHLVGSAAAGSPGEERNLARGFSEVLRNRRVLIADDDVRNIFSLTRSLEHHGMQVISALDGESALRMLDEHPDVDVVLMDMMMPVMDGYQSITAIRKKPAFSKLPILAVTAKAMMGDREKCMAAGASDYISKPVDIDQLLSLLRVWLYHSPHSNN